MEDEVLFHMMRIRMKLYEAALCSPLLSCPFTCYFYMNEMNEGIVHPSLYLAD